MRIDFFSTKSYEIPFFETENQKYGFELKFHEEKLTSDTAHIAEGDAVCCFVQDDLKGKTLEILKQKKIKFILLRCAGFNQVDLKQAEKQSLVVANVPEYSPYAVAEHAAGLMLALNRKIHKAYMHVREGNFSLEGLMGFDIHRKVVGIIGTGHIGKCFGHIISGFGARLVGYDLAPDHTWAKKIDLTYVSLEELYKQSDIISLHLPLNDQSYHLVCKESLQKMKKGVMLINTGRGALIKSDDMIEALKSGHVGYLAMDVYEEEGNIFFQNLSSTIIQDDTLARLLTFPNVIITSHQGFFTKEAMENIASTALHNLFLLSKNEKCPNLVHYPKDDLS
jgi:D-lactate dehydrogenase